MFRGILFLGKCIFHNGNFYKQTFSKQEVGNSIERRLKEGDYIKPDKGTNVSAKYIQINKENLNFYKGYNGNGIVRRGYSLVKDKEIKNAQEYFERLLGAEPGKIVKGFSMEFGLWEDEISEIPSEPDPVKKPWEIVKTKKGYRIWISDLPYSLVE